MPIYEYHCQSCGTTFEVEQRITDPPLTIHNGCGGEVKRLISSTSFILKGSGWYKTDYARSTREEKEGKGKEESASSEKPSTPCGENCACASS